MNVSSALVLVLVVALAAFAVRRTLKKGAPCACGGNRKSCGCGCCREHGGREEFVSHKEQ